MRNVREFGAVGDGIANDTKAVQAAIDAGGMIAFPPGTYRCGTLYLKSGGGLYLEAGAKILAGNNPADYNADDFIVQNRASKVEKCSGAHLICAVNQHDITICGAGTIDGNSEEIFSGMAHNPDDLNYYHIPAWRIGQMIFFCECTEIAITGVKLRNSTYWSCFFHGCRNVIVRGLDIRSDRFVRNSDGIDVDCCQNVIISDCLIDTGDDGITLRGNADPLENKRPCEHVTITNCVISSTCSGMRIGVGNGIIRNCLISNVCFYNTKTGLCFCSRYNQAYTEISGISFQHINFSGNRFLEIVNDWRGRFDDPAGAPVRNLYFSDIQVACSGPSFLIGNNGFGIEDIALERVRIDVSGEYLCCEEYASGSLYNRWWYRQSKALFLAANINGLKFSDIRVRWPENTPYEYGLETFSVSDLTIESCQFNHEIQNN